MASQQPNSKRYNRGVSVNSVLNQGYVITKGGVSIRVYEYDVNGDIVRATGTAASTTQDSIAGYAKGALYIDTDVATATKALYENVGTTTSSSFNLIGDITAGEITLAEGSTLVGNASGVATAVVAKTSGRILVGNGTTAVLVAVSGDATLSSAGAVTVTGANAAFNIGTNETWTKEVNHTSTVTTTTTAATAGGNLTHTAGQGATTGAGGAYAAAGGASGTGATGNGGSASLTGGAAASTNGNGGDVIIGGGAGTGTGVGGSIFNRSLASVKQLTPSAKTTSATLTTIEIFSGIITVNQGAGGTSALQLPLATSMDTDFASFTTNDAVDISVINISTVDAEDASITTNTGWTLVGSMDIPANNGSSVTNNCSARLRLRKTGAGAWTAYRIA